MPSAIVLRKDVRLDVPSIADYYAKALDLNVQDVRLVIRKARGIFQEFQEEDRARAIAQALGKVGIEADVIPQANIPKAPTVRRVFNGSVGKSGLELVFHPMKPPVELRWEDVHFVSIGVIATPKYDEVVTAKGFGSYSKAFESLPHRELVLTADEETRVKGRALHKPKLLKGDLDTLYSEHTEGYADLWTYGSTHRFRVSRRDFNYGSLGKRIGKKSWNNFRILVSEIHARAPKALFTKMSKDYMLGAEFYEIIFDNLEEFDRYSRWFLHQAAGASPQPGVISPTASKDLLGPVVEPVDEVESVE